LIVDDEPLVRELFNLALRTLGYEVSEANDGEQALALLRRRSYSLMLLDLQMPLVNGKTVLTSVRQMFLHDKMKIVVITADALRASDEVHAIADRVMFKPIDMREFLTTVKSLVGDCIVPGKDVEVPPIVAPEPALKVDVPIMAEALPKTETLVPVAVPAKTEPIISTSLTDMPPTKPLAAVPSLETSEKPVGAENKDEGKPGAAPDLPVAAT
jgi:CheY-like chemotaxis protein